MHDWRYDYDAVFSSDAEKKEKWRREGNLIHLESASSPTPTWQILLLLSLLAVLVGVLLAPPTIGDNNEREVHDHSGVHD